MLCTYEYQNNIAYFKWHLFCAFESGLDDPDEKDDDEEEEEDDEEDEDERGEETKLKEAVIIPFILPLDIC